MHVAIEVTKLLFVTLGRKLQPLDQRKRDPLKRSLRQLKQKTTVPTQTPYLATCMEPENTG